MGSPVKSLQLEHTYRVYLKGRGALCISDDGCEALVGLTPSESVAYLVMQEQVAAGNISNDLRQLQIYLELVNRHEAALPTTSWCVRVLDIEGASLNKL